MLEIAEGIKFNESKQKGPAFNERTLQSVTSFWAAEREGESATQYQFLHTFFISSSKIQ